MKAMRSTPPPPSYSQGMGACVVAACSAPEALVLSLQLALKLIRLAHQDHACGQTKGWRLCDCSSRRNPGEGTEVGKGEKKGGGREVYRGVGANGLDEEGYISDTSSPEHPARRTPLS